MAVVPVALGVLRLELSGMKQDPEEPFRTFAARVQGKAETCEFRTIYNGSCTGCNSPYSGHVYYTDEMVRDVLLNGIADIDIRREALSADGIQNKPITEVITFIENKEIARNANPSFNLSAISSYRQNRRNDPPADKSNSKDRWIPTQAEREKITNCPDCGKIFNLFSKKSRGWNVKPHQKCEGCWKKQRERKRAENSSI